MSPPHQSHPLVCPLASFLATGLRYHLGLQLYASQPIDLDLRQGFSPDAKRRLDSYDPIQAPTQASRNDGSTRVGWRTPHYLHHRFNKQLDSNEW